MSRRSILARLNRLEKEARVYSCHLCNGGGRIISVRTHIEPDPVDPEGCPGCGRITIIRVTRVERVEQNLQPVVQVSYC